MATIKVHDKTFETYLSEKNIQDRIAALAAAIDADYGNKKPLFIAILNGSFIFAADLFRYLKIDAEINFIKLVSYKGIKSTGNVVTAIGLDDDLFGRDVVIVEDIVDTGKTLHEFLLKLMHQQPSSLKIVTLLHKADATKYPIQL